MVAAVDKKFRLMQPLPYLSLRFSMPSTAGCPHDRGPTSRFGVEYDSLSDVIAFGVAPGFWCTCGP